AASFSALSLLDGRASGLAGSYASPGLAAAILAGSLMATAMSAADDRVGWICQVSFSAASAGNVISIPSSVIVLPGAALMGWPSGTGVMTKSTPSNLT